MRGELSLFDIERGIERGIEIHRRQLDYDPIYAIELSPDRGLLAIAFRSSRVQIVEPETGKIRHVLKQLTQRHDYLFFCLPRMIRLFQQDLELRRVFAFVGTLHVGRIESIHHQQGFYLEVLFPVEDGLFNAAESGLISAKNRPCGASKKACHGGGIRLARGEVR
jgi:hypothetical protein